VERCPRCLGAGVLFGNDAQALQELAASLIGGGAADVFAAAGEGALIRALAFAAAHLERRVGAVEATVAKLV